MLLSMDLLRVNFLYLLNEMSQLKNNAAVLPFIPLSVFEEIAVLDPLDAFPDPDTTGGTEWKRLTEIASDLFERCPGREWIRNVTQFSHTWKCKSWLQDCNFLLTLTRPMECHHSSGASSSAIPAQ